MKKALITGCSGQDGTLLYEYLSDLNYFVLGVDTLEMLTVAPGNVTHIDLCDLKSVKTLLDDFKPDEIYHLAAFHHSAEEKRENDIELLKNSYEVNVLAVATLLESVRLLGSHSKLFYAASSHMFGIPQKSVQTENTMFNPMSIYGISKRTGTEICQYYRNFHKIFASVGILYNHESPLRQSKFVSKKIVKSVVAIYQKRLDSLMLGDLNTRVDWGYAGDYVAAMHLILQENEPDNFIISSGKTHSVKDFVEIAFNYVGLDWKKYVTEEVNIVKDTHKGTLCGDNTKLKSTTGWTQNVSFNELVELMMKHELKTHE